MFVRITGNKESDWSNKFSLDAIGNEGVFTCKLKNSPIELQVTEFHKPELTELCN